MPTDKSGKFHMNTQRAMAADKHPMPAKPKTMEPPAGKDPSAEQGGPEPGSISEHLAAMHAEHGGQHMHVHQGDDGSVTTHHVGHDGKTEGPHEHPDLEAAKMHMEAILGHGAPAEHGKPPMPQHDPVPEPSMMGGY